MNETGKKEIIPRWRLPLLAVIVAIGIAVRLIRLDSVPPGFYIDEASFGYNAYSILETGHDEFGNYLPLYTPSFGTGKDPVYLYAAVASVKLFGLNEFAVRLPAAVFGSFTIWFTYLLALALTKRRGIGYLAALFLALSPWHILFSRFAIEVSSVPFFTTLGFYLLVRGLKRPAMLSWGALVLGVGLHTYAPAIPFILLMFPIFIIVYRKHLGGMKKQVATASVILIIFAAAHAIPSLKPDNQLQHFKKSTILNPSHDTDSREFLKISSWPAPLFADAKPPLLRTAIFVRNYLSNYSPRYLFFDGDTSTFRAHVKGYGAFYAIFIPALIAGLILIILSRAPECRFLLLWLLVYPIGASITNQSCAQATRTITALPAYEIIFAIAVVAIADMARRQMRSDILSLARFARKITIVIFTALFILYFCCAGRFIRHFFTEYPEYSSLEWNAGFREAFKITENRKNDFREVVVSKNIPYSYIYALFYTKYDPELLQTYPLDTDGVYRVGQIGKYVVRDPYLQFPRLRQLFITGFWERPDLKKIPIIISGGIPSKVRLGIYTPDK
jgi:4-amino-4-deoxy-L-arabinose transferase-like glycosyltransferase